MRINKQTLTEPIVRKGMYIVVGAAMWVAVYFGVVDSDQADAISASPAVAGVVLWLAAAMTHRGSNSTATDEDVSAARVKGEQDALQRFSAPLVDEYGRHSADPSEAAKETAEDPADAAEYAAGAAYPGGVS